MNTVQVPAKTLAVQLFVYIVASGGAIAFLLGFLKERLSFPAMTALVVWLGQLSLYPAFRLYVAAFRPSYNVPPAPFVRWAAFVTGTALAVFVSAHLLHS